MTDSKHNSQLLDIDETLIEARQLVESGKHRQARDLLRQIGKADPNNDEVFLLFAQAASKNEQAIYCLNRALEINPASEPARRLLDSLQSPAIPTDHHPDEQTEPVREASSVENGSSQQTGIENAWSKEDGLRPEKRQSEGRSRLMLYIIAGVLGTVVVGFLLARIFGTLSSNARVRDRYRNNVNLFLLEGERLSALTEQGVSYLDFKDQLANVKSAYRLAVSDWPADYADDKMVFDAAIEGWNLVLEIWDYDLEYDRFYFPDSSTLLSEAQLYAGERDETTNDIPVNDWIGLLMSIASNKFAGGRASLTANLR